jgi:signal transduction histidine kinase
MTLRDSVTAAKALVPGLRRIVLVGDALERQTYRRFAGDELPALAAEFELIDLRGLPISDVRTLLSTLPADAAVFYLGITTDGAGAEFLSRDALKIVSETANRPIIVDSEPHLGSGGTGGFVTDPSVVGRAAARIALRVLNGEDASAIPVSPSNSRRPVFDWRELQRWKVSEAMLPPGSEVRFRVPALWETYRDALVAVALIIVLQTGLIAALLIERRRRRGAELEARRRFVEVAHMSRTATAGALSASIAHELRQPLAAILSNAEAAEVLLDAKEPDLAVIREILVDIIGADQRASEIIAHLRGLLRPGASDPTETDLNHAAKDVLHIVRAEADKRGITLGAELDRRPLMVRADLVHLQQIMLNLSMNAMDAMLDSAPGNRRLKLETAQVGDTSAEVIVSDSGEGIPPEKLKSIFEPFFTTKEHGIGLGLSIVRTIVETYGGKIWAENRAGGGAVLRFTLPLAKVLA